MVLSLIGYEIGDEGVRYIAQVLKRSRILEHVCLEASQMSGKGAWYLSEALRANTTLQELNLDADRIGKWVYKAIQDKVLASRSLATRDNSLA